LFFLAIVVGNITSGGVPTQLTTSAYTSVAAANNYIKTIPSFINSKFTRFNYFSSLFAFLYMLLLVRWPLPAKVRTQMYWYRNTVKSISVAIV